MTTPDIVHDMTILFDICIEESLAFYTNMH